MTTTETPPSVVAALLLLVQDLVPGCPEWPRTATDAVALSGAGRSQAYEMLGRLRNLLPSLLGTPGRPATPPPAKNAASLAVAVAVRDYVQAHPGAACGGGVRATYTDAFRRFVVGLTAPNEAGEEMSVVDLAFATGVLPGTLKDWLSSPPPKGNPDTATVAPSLVQDAEMPTVQNVHLRLIATLWPSWKGPFQAFCHSLRTEHRLRYGDTFIGNVLHSLGLRQRRPHTPVEAPWSSNTFRQFFPGAQWLGDGSTLALRWGEETFAFNLEALIDVASNAVVGITVTDTEDEEA
ncbi:MAG: hypothetical protein ACRDX8_11615, partial [Acidimicrobiales bacterium]